MSTSLSQQQFLSPEAEDWLFEQENEPVPSLSGEAREWLGLPPDLTDEQKRERRQQAEAAARSDKLFQEALKLPSPVSAMRRYAQLEKQVGLEATGSLPQILKKERVIDDLSAIARSAVKTGSGAVAGMSEFVSALGNSVPLLRAVLPDRLLISDVADYVDALADLYTPEDMRMRQKFERQIMDGIGSTAPFVLASMTPLGILGAAGAGIGVGARQQGIEAESFGAMPDEKRKAILAGGLVGSLEAALPAALRGKFVSRILKPLDKFTKGAFTKAIVKGGGELTLDGATEALQEATSSVLNNVIAKNLYDQNRDIFDNAAESGAVGGVVGLILGTIFKGARLAGRRTAGGEYVSPEPEQLLNVVPATMEQAAADSAAVGGELNVEAQRKLIEDYEQRKAAGQSDPVPRIETFEEAGYGRPTRKQRRAILQEIADAQKEQAKAEAQTEAKAGSQAAQGAQTQRVLNEPAQATEPAQPAGQAPGVVEAGAAETVQIEQPRALRVAAKKARTEAGAAFDALAEYTRDKTFSNPLFDPQLIRLAGDVVAKSVKAGVVSFADVVAETARVIGVETTRKLAPVLRARWNMLRAENEGLQEAEPVDQVLSRIIGKPLVTPGRPDLANPAVSPGARDLVDVADAERAATEVRSDEEVQAEAAVRLELDYVGERARLLRTAREGGQLSDTDTAVAKAIVERDGVEALAGDDVDAIKAAIDLVDSYRLTGTEQARGFRQRRDPVETPEQRRARMIGEAILTPPQKQLKKLDRAIKNGDSAEADRIRELWAKDVAKLKAELRALGIDLVKIRELAKDSVATARAFGQISAAKADVWDAAHEYFRNSVLSGLPTQAVNIIGNASNATWTLTAQRLVEAITNLAIRDPKAAQFGEFKHLYGGVLPGLSRAARNFARTWTTEVPFFEKEVGTIEPERQTKLDQPGVAISGFKGRVIRAPQRFLLAADEFAKSLFGTMDAAAQAYRMATAEGLRGQQRESRMRELLNDLESEAWTRALQTARELAFQEKGGVFTKAALQVRRDVPGARYLMLFITTPASIFRQGLRRSPLGSLVLPYRVVEALRSGDRSVLNQRVAEQILGWAAALILMDMTDPDDPWITGTGRYDEYPPPQSIRIAGEWFSYSRIEPFATIAATTIDMIDGVRRGGGTAVGKPITTVINQARDKTFLQSLGDVADVIERSRRGDGLEAIADWASNFAVSWIPNLIRSGSRGMQQQYQERRVWGDGSEWWKRLGKRTLQKTELKLLADQPKIDLWGREIERPGAPGGGPATDTVWRMIMPSGFREDAATKGDRMILNWNNQNPEDAKIVIGPARPYYTKDKKTHYMDDEQFTQYLKLAGSFALADVERLSTTDDNPLNIDNPSTKDMERLRSIIARARRKAKLQVLGKEQ